jgi:hypothetical protein
LKTIFLGSFCALFLGCHATKKVTQPVDNQVITTKISVENLTKSAAENTLHANRFSAHADLEISAPPQPYLEASANIFWVRDSMLWIQVKKFGFEGARVLVRADSVFYLNRIDQTFFAESIQFLKEKYQMPADFSVVNAFMTGEIWLLPDAEIESRTELGRAILTATSRKTSIFEEILFKNAPLLCENILFRDKSSGQTARSNFGDWKKIDGQNGYFSFLRRVEMSSPTVEKTTIEMKLSDLNFSPKKGGKFEIPSHYKRVSMR